MLFLHTWTGVGYLGIVMAQPEGKIVAADRQTSNCVSSEDFIRALFESILERNLVSETELGYWVGELMSGRDAAEIVRLFFHSEEKQAKQLAAKQSSTKYPHGHFYSPVVNVLEVEQREEIVFRKKTPSAVDLNVSGQIDMLETLGKHMHTIPFTDEKNSKYRYYYNNTSYAFGDACVYWGMIGALQPKRIIEIGSGYTSALALDAIEHHRLDTQCTFVDPHPELLMHVAAPIPSRHEVVAELVQDMDLDRLKALERGDILFIDSSHVVKTGSDVHFELSEMLPLLRSGVIVHFHDVFYPLEYPKAWVIEDNLSWNEIYFLHAFLQYNGSFRITYFNDFIAKERVMELRRVVPDAMASRIELNPGGGLWLQRA